MLEVAGVLESGWFAQPGDRTTFPHAVLPNAPAQGRDKDASMSLSLVPQASIGCRCGKPAAVGGDPVRRLPEPEQRLLVTAADEARFADLLGGDGRKVRVEPDGLLRLPDAALGLTRIGIFQPCIAERLDIAGAERHGTIQVKAGAGEVAPHLEQHAEQPMSLRIQGIEGNRLLRMADRPLPPAVFFSSGVIPPVENVAHGEAAMGGRRGRILLERAAEIPSALACDAWAIERWCSRPRRQCS